jgi:peptide/nickel transport system permease protein
MLPFVMRRLLIAIPLLLLSSILVFCLVLAAGDPLEDARGKPNNAAQIAALTRLYNLDQGPVQRYVTWFTGFVRGDWGKDRTGQEVRPQIYQAIQVTLRLVLIAQFLAIILGLTVGIISAIRQYTAFDYTSTAISFLFYAMPVFWFAVVLKEYFAIKVNDVIEGWGGPRWIQTTGSSDINFHGGMWDRFLDYAAHGLLPTITLTVIAYAGYSRFMRASMLETMSTDYVRTARAKGISEKRVIMRHGFRNALIPVTTAIAIDFGFILAGAVFTEKVFSWQGMGKLLVESVTKLDVNMLLAWVMVTAVMVVLFNIIADVAYAYLDPRIRLE